MTSCVQVNENFSGTGGKRSGGRKRNSTLIDLLDKVNLLGFRVLGLLFQTMLDMVHLGSKVCSATAAKDILAVSLHSQPHEQNRTLLQCLASIFASNIAKVNACTLCNVFNCLDSNCSHCTGTKHAGLDTSC